MDRLVRLFIASISLQGMTYLQERGHEVRMPRTFRGEGSYGAQRIEGVYGRPSLKLCAFEAGLGVYGRAGLIIHPVLGNRLRLGALLTDATLEPDPRLEGFEPCTDCDLCITHCPARAYDAARRYPASWSRATCTARRAEIAERELYCHNCFAICPAGQIADEDLLRLEEATSFLLHERR
jgi:epoxyqueuosine reductase QueG